MHVTMYDTNYTKYSLSDTHSFHVAFYIRLHTHTHTNAEYKLDAMPNASCAVQLVSHSVLHSECDIAW